MSNKMSVIMCVYNIEKYLEKAIESILNQTHKNIEFIIIDDHSTDNSKKIIKKYEKSYDNIIFIQNSHNRGAAYCRNIGLKQATGEYVGFIDSDDYVPNDYYEILLKKMISDNSDIVVCDINSIYEYSDNSTTTIPGCIGKINKLNMINNGMAASSCNKLFKKSLLEKYPYPENIINEDIATVIPCIVHANKVSYTQETHYNYIQRKNSVQNSSFTQKKFDVFKSMEITLNAIKGVPKYSEYKDALIFNQIILFLFYIIPNEKNFFKRLKILRQYQKYVKKYEITKNKNLKKFLESHGRYHQIYYKYLVIFSDKGFNLFTNILIWMVDLYNKKFKRSVIKKEISLNDLISLAKKQQKKKADISISVVIPNYNYEKFMYQRIYSILSQTEKINELIILDDCSKDNSRALIDKLEKHLKNFIHIKKVYNDTNSGSAFKQWEKGFSLATSDYVWIAEADDYCKKNFLKNVIKPTKKDSNIVLSYADTAFIDKDGIIIMRTIKPEIDILKTGHWNHNFINKGLLEIKNYAYLNCTIANVSSVLFKKDNYRKFFKQAGKYKQAGDWLFYINVMSCGNVAFTNKPLNYYRIHGNNVTSVTKKEAHLKEIEKIHQYCDKTYKLNKNQKKQIEKRYKFLKKVWQLDI